MNDMEMLERIESKLNKSKKDYDILTGKLESANEELKKLGYSTVKEANKKLALIETEVEKTENEFDSLMAEFKENYPELVDYA